LLLPGPTRCRCLPRRCRTAPARSSAWRSSQCATAAPGTGGRSMVLHACMPQKLHGCARGAAWSCGWCPLCMAFTQRRRTQCPHGSAWTKTNKHPAHQRTVNEVVAQGSLLVLVLASISSAPRLRLPSRAIVLDVHRSDPEGWRGGYPTGKGVVHPTTGGVSDLRVGTSKFSF
jgi:hypothetical protein